MVRIVGDPGFREALGDAAQDGLAVGSRQIRKDEIRANQRGEIDDFRQGQSSGEISP